MPTVIPKRHRPIFDGLESDEEKFKVAMAEYNELKDPDENGLDFSNKTSMWIAFERDIESQREDRLFHDPLAKHFSEPYGKRLSDAMSLGLAFSVFDPPGADIEFGLEGHVMYTAARTKLISNQMEEWLSDMTGECQVLNLGAGLDTRAYWQDSLKKVQSYWEIDTQSVMKHKQKILDQLHAKGELPPTICPRKPIIMDFSKESIADLPSKHGYAANIPACWILEGLIMYLKREQVEQLIDRLSSLSASGSFLIVNFSDNPKAPADACPPIAEIDQRLEGTGWRQHKRLMFGEEGFNFGRYPDGKPANKTLGFAMYQKA